MSPLLVETLAQALSTDILSLGLSAATLGVLSHVSVFCRLPVEEYLDNLLLMYIATTAAIGVAYLSVTDVSLMQALFRVGVITSAFNIGLASSIGIYRLFFHRLHRFPGPTLSKLSRFYDAYLAGKNLQYNVEIEKMHKTYGDFIRTGKFAKAIERWLPWIDGYSLTRPPRAMHRSQISTTTAPFYTNQMRQINLLRPDTYQVRILLR